MLLHQSVLEELYSTTEEEKESDSHWDTVLWGEGRTHCFRLLGNVLAVVVLTCVLHTFIVRGRPCLVHLKGTQKRNQVSRIHTGNTNTPTYTQIVTHILT